MAERSLNSGPPMDEMFALPSGKAMLPVLGAFSPAVMRGPGVCKSEGTGVAKHPQTDRHEPIFNLTWRIAVGPRTRLETTASAYASDLNDDGLAFLSKEVRRAFGPEGLKHLIGLLIALHENFHNGLFVFDSDAHLDRLGYQRREVGGKLYHHPHNVRKARQILSILASLTLKIIRRSNGKTEEITIRLFTVWANSATFPAAPVGWDNGEVPAVKQLRTPLAERVMVAANPLWYGGVLQNGASRDTNGGKQYTWQLKQLAGEDSRRHGLTLLLGLLLP